MIEAAVQGLLLVLEWPTIGYLLLGVAIGFVVGLLPGLGGAVTLALLLPFTFALSPPAAFALLLAVSAVSDTTGDITATLLGVPGEATSAANVLDGYPMTKKGEGGRALGAVLMSSFVGAAFGAVVLALAIPVARPVVLAFGSPEFFMLIVVGLTFIAALGSGAMLKSLIIALLGLLLSTVGVDPQGGVQRFTFGQLGLWDGIGLVPVALGLFAIPEILDLGIRKTSISEVKVKLSGISEGVRDTFRHIWLTLRCSAIGVFIGILPGLGSSVAQWVAYSHAVQTSPRYDEDGNPRFGHGAIEGVLGAGAVNNAKNGGGLVPTIVFGIPGGVSAAILLGAFLIHGLVPGPDMLTQHLALTMSFVWVLVLSNFVATAIAFAFLRPIIKIATVRAGLVVPPVLLLLFTGAFASRNRIEDVVIMLVFGLLGVAMLQFGWPRAPLVLGLVLGNLAENYLFLSVRRYDMQWLTRPVVLFLIVVAAVSVWYPLRKDKQQRPGPPANAAVPPPPREDVE
jgi:putative tricarboxylic transport membrane protein